MLGKQGGGRERHQFDRMLDKSSRDVDWRNIIFAGRNKACPGAKTLGVPSDDLRSTQILLFMC